jgi:hypothetical protein
LDQRRRERFSCTESTSGAVWLLVNRRSRGVVDEPASDCYSLGHQIRSPRRLRSGRSEFLRQQRRVAIQNRVETRLIARKSVELHNLRISVVSPPTLRRQTGVKGHLHTNGDIIFGGRERDVLLGYVVFVFFCRYDLIQSVI